MFKIRTGCSRIHSCWGWKLHILAILFQKVCKSVLAHRTPQNKLHACTSHTLFRMNFARTRTNATAHRTFACVDAPSQLTLCMYVLWHLFIFFSRSGAGGFSSRKSGFRTDRTDTEHEDNDHRPGNVGKSAYFSSASIPASCTKLLNMFRKITFLFTQLSNSSDNVWVATKVTKHSSNTLLRLVPFLWLRH